MQVKYRCSHCHCQEMFSSGLSLFSRRHAARSLDARAPTATLDAAIAKRFATDACFDVANRALQIFGGHGPSCLLAGSDAALPEGPVGC